MDFDIKFKDVDYSFNDVSNLRGISKGFKISIIFRLVKIEVYFLNELINLVVVVEVERRSF